MDPNLARQMFEEGGTLVLLGMPIGTEFGIDLNFWNVGEKFRGVKMIPPGLHFIYFSAVSRQGDTAPRTGFFHLFEPREVLVRYYDPAAEDLKPEETNPTEVENIRANLRNLDCHLGAYPIESWSKWVSLTQHISPSELRRMVPLSGIICSAPELVTEGEKDGRREWGRSRGAEGASSAVEMTEFSQAQSTITTTTTTTTPVSSSSTPSTLVTSSTTPTTSCSTTDLTTSCSTTDLTTSCFTTDLTTSLTTNHTTPASTQEDTILTIDTTNSGTHEESPTLTLIPKDPKTIPRIPNMVPRPGTEVRFTKFPERPYHNGATPSEVTRHCLDSTYSVRRMMEGLESVNSLVSELQLAFVIFLVGQAWEGWEQWRSLISSLCRAQQLLEEEPQLYDCLMSVLHFQISEVPEDLFVDIVENNNFLASALATLFANIADGHSTLPLSLTRKADRFKAHLSAKFDWDLSLEDNGEDAPVVVEL